MASSTAVWTSRHPGPKPICAPESRGDSARLTGKRGLYLFRELVPPLFHENGRASEVRRLLERICQRQEVGLGVRAPEELDADRHRVISETGGDRDRRQPGRGTRGA